MCGLQKHTEKCTQYEGDRTFLSPFLCWLIQRILLLSREATPVAVHSVVLCLPLCKAFPSSHMESPGERGAEPGRPNKLQPFPQLTPALLVFPAPKSTTSREGKGLGGCRTASPLHCDPLLTSSPQPLSPHQPAYRERKTEECSRRSLRLGLDQKCPSLLDRTHQETKIFASKTSKTCFLKPSAFAKFNWRVRCDSQWGTCWTHSHFQHTLTTKYSQKEAPLAVNVVCSQQPS